MKVVNYDLFAYSHNILNRQIYFYLLLNVHWISDIRQTEIHTAETLVSELSHFEAEITVGKFIN
jgi:hypothetical protein